MGRGHFKSSQANLTNTGIKNRDRRDREPLKVTWSDPCLSKSRVERGGWRVEGGGRGKAGGPVRNSSSGQCHGRKEEGHCKATREVELTEHGGSV